MRIRQIKPDFWKDMNLATMSLGARLTFIGLWMMADCEGKLHADPRLVKADLFPLDDTVTAQMVDGWLLELASGEKPVITQYVLSNQRYILVKNFKRHQRLMGNESKGESNIPDPPETPDNPDPTGSTYRVRTQYVPSNPDIRSNGVTDKRSNGGTDPTRDVVAPTPKKYKSEPKGTRLPEDWQPDESLLEWAKAERPDLPIDKVIDSFKDHWCAVSTQNGIKSNWVATFRNWVRREDVGKYRYVSATQQKEKDNESGGMYAGIFRNQSMRAEIDLKEADLIYEMDKKAREERHANVR